MTSFLDVVSPGAGRRFASAYHAETGRRLTAWREARELLDRLQETPDDPIDLRMFDAKVNEVAGRL
jgi:hypothetical protein